MSNKTSVQSKPKLKPLSFDTTIRNPERLPSFLKCIVPFEGKVLTNEVIHEIIKTVLKNKIYCTEYQKQIHELINIFKSEEDVYSDSQLEEIIKNAPQKHKVAGFVYGWPSRFDTWYKLSKELGFIDYSFEEPIHISQTGHMLVEAYNENPINTVKIQKLYLNAFMKYQRKIPYRRVLNDNVPLSLLLRVCKIINKSSHSSKCGVHILEIPFFLCWPNNDEKGLANYILDFRKNHSFGQYSSEIVYKKCLDMLQSKNENYFKQSKICGESIDDYIRKMRMTGLISIRGNGRFVDLNSLEKDTIDYVIQNYSETKSFNDESSYFNYMGQIDENVLKFSQSESVISKNHIRKIALEKYAKSYSKEEILSELRLLKQNKNSKDELLKLISGPTRLEFLTSIALVQNFYGLDVNPNYSVDDEGVPTFTAGGGMADIVRYDSDYDSYFEVTLMKGRTEQICNEMIPICRHLKEAKENVRKESFSVFVAPVVHSDVYEYIDWKKAKDGLDLVAYDIDEFVNKISKISKASALLNKVTFTRKQVKR